MAQLGARLNRTQEVRGSIPLSSTKIKQGVNSKGLTPFLVDCMGVVLWGFGGASISYRWKKVEKKVTLKLWSFD